MGTIISQIFSRFKTPVRILMVGLDAAGKTCLLYRLKLGKMVTTLPTIGFKVETVKYKNISFDVWDVRAPFDSPLWRHFYPNTQLDEDQLAEVPVLIFANKQDLPQAMSVSDITEALNLSGVKQPWFV
ncbi:PREDICTED: ADP-ribosylation factor 1-like, partial [Cyprinodon variegatus]|uniref:ADP-ribosylation factor 1-like n=1 Tax=Cyprinodon variegatus TaxID=28743 RepID=UPI00074297B8